MADSIVTKQALIDAQKDAQALEEVINGEPGKLIKTRLGRLVYTLASVPQINTMTREEVTGLVAPKADKTYVDTALTGFTNGASKFYPTLAEATADIANIGIKDKVDIGETANGGIWYKATAGATSLTKSPYDPLAQAKTYADQGIKEFVNQSYVGPVQVLRNGVVWELPAGETSNGSEAQSPGFDARWIRKTYANVKQKLDRKYAPYISLNSNGVSTDVASEYAQKVDDAIKKLTLTGKIPSYKYVSLETFNVKRNVAANTATIGFKMVLSNTTSGASSSDDTAITANNTVTVDNNGYATIYGSKHNSTFFEAVLDVSGFLDAVQYNFGASNKANGALNSTIIFTQKEQYFSGNISEPYNANGNYKGNPFAFMRAVKNITTAGNFANKTLHLTRIERTASVVLIDFNVKDSTAGISTSLRKQYTIADFVGLLDVSPAAFSGSNTRSLDYAISMTLDADYLNKHFASSTFKLEPIDTNVPLNAQTPASAILAVNQYDLTGAGYADYRGMWYATSTYRRMSVGKKIPIGATSLEAIGGFDKNANILFGDINGQLLGYAWTNADGTKYSGEDTATTITSAIPPGAYYFHMSTTLASVAAATLTFNGDFKLTRKTDFSSIQEAILDSSVQNGIYTAGKYLFRKNDTNINNVEVIDSTNLALADTYKASGLKQGKSQGQLVFHKEGKYYYYHGSNREIYVEENGIKTTLTSPSLHPTVWALSLGQQQQRTVIEVLDDDSILFSMKETQTDGNITYSLWKMEVGGEPVRCFMYSNDFSMKADNSLQSANGCPLGEWSFAYAEGLIFATEYGEGTAKWWSDQGQNGGNGKGVSSRVWVSKDNGNTWYICLNLNELKNPALPQSDSNWKYFSDTNAKNYCHIHMIKYDTYDKRVYISNGDGENYLWSIDLKSLKVWLTSAPAVNPNAIPVYADPCGLTWNAVRLCTYQNQPNINYHNMKFQMTALYPIEQGLLMGHDAPREFMYLAHRKGILTQSTFRFEPSYNYERSTDFDFDYDFKASQDTTDGFVQVMTRNKKTDPVLIFNSTSGKYCKIWATYNGFAHQLVFESELKEVTFGCRAFFDEKGNIILSTGAGTTAINSGYYLLSINRT